MTTAEQLLGLARAVYGDRVYTGTANKDDVWIRGEYAFPSPPKNSELFDPANNADQFCEVLAWLLRHRGALPHRHHELTPWHVKEVYFTDDNEPIIASLVMHDGTASGLRLAVTDAAVRVFRVVKS